MAIILPANTLSAGGFSVANSCRFNGADNASMSKSISSTSTTWTFSAWIKRGDTGTPSRFLVSWGGDNWTGVGFGSTDYIQYYDVASESNPVTTAKYRDPAAWMHLVVKNNAGTITFYVNGATPAGSGGTTGHALSSTTLYIGNLPDNSADFDGYLAEVVFIDGTAYSASDFGEFDEDSPTIWKPKDVSGLTFGSDGFYLDFEDSANLGNDANGGTDLTETNIAATDQATDTPTNNFCVGNPLDNYYYASTFSEGNCKITTNASNKTYNTSTFAVTAGKWYFECKASDTNSDDAQFGIASVLSTATDDELKTSAGNYCYRSGGTKATGDSSTSYGATWNDDADIISVALDLTNLKIYFAKNGTWQDSGDPTSGATGTGAAFTITAPASQTIAGSIQAYTPAFGEEGAQSDVFELNFGNPSYANSSDAADANGYGKFEYAPPSGYLALCTKNLGSDGG